MPGNAGTEEISTNLNIDILNFEKVYEKIKEHQIDLVIVGLKIPLVHGIVDFLEDKKIEFLGQIKKLLN